MTRLLVSTVRRHTPPSEASGYLYLVDLKDQQVIRRSSIIEPAYKTLETNPRGGMRGSKGIAVRSDQIAITNSSMVFRYSPHWDLLGVITHPSCSGIHDILFQDDTLWVSSAGSDLMIQFDLAGKIQRSLYMREPSPALDALDWQPPLLLNEAQIHQGQIDFRNPSTHDPIAFDNAHVNSLGILPNGDLLISLGFVIGLEFAALVRWKMWLMRRGIWPLVLSVNGMIRKALRKGAKNADQTLVAKPASARSAVIRVCPDGSHCLSLMLNDVTTPSHSLLVLPDNMVIYLNTSEGKVLCFDPLSGEIQFSVKVSDGFLRGAELLNQNLLVLGSKDKLLMFDMNDQAVIGSIILTDDPVESVYDVKVLPDHYNLPPESFLDHLTQATGFRSAEELIRSGGSLPV